MQTIIPVVFTLIVMGTSLVVFWPISVLFHEIGHAIPMLIFSKKSVLIFVGDKNNSKKFFEYKVGRLQFKLGYDSFLVSGFAQMTEHLQLPKWKLIIIDLWGPIFSSILCAILFFSAFYLDLHGFFKFLIIGFLLHSFIELCFIFNYHIFLENQYYVFSDGANLYHRIFKKYGLTEINHALFMFYSQEYDSSAKLMEQIIADGFDESYFLHRYLISLCYNGSSSQSYEVYSSSNFKYIISPIDKSQFGATLLLNGNENGKHLILDAFQENPKDDTILANKAFLSLEEGNYTSAKEIFTYLLHSPNFKSYAFANLTLARYLSKTENIGLSHFDKCVEEYPLEVYAYRNKGIYLYDKEDYKEAIKYFRSAIKKDKYCYQANEYFDRCLAKLKHKTDENNIN